MTYHIQEHTIGEILLRVWLPGVVSVLFGSLLLAILVPRFQSGFERDRIREQHRAETYENVAGEFVPFLQNWRRTLLQAKFQMKADTTSEDIMKSSERLDRAQLDRNRAIDSLLVSLAKARIYFDSADFTKGVNDFDKWIERIRTLHANEGPQDVKQFEKYRDAILDAMRTEVRKK